MAILPTKSITQQILALSPTQSCEEKATMKMATMRFSSAQGASDYRKQLINECMATASSPTATGTVTNTVSTNLTPTPKPTATVVNTISTNLAPAPVKPGVSAIVQPDFSTVKVYDLDAPSGSPSGSPSGNAMVASSSGGSKGSSEEISEEISEGNKEDTSSVVAVAKKPNYLLYLGLVISGVIVYKTFLKKE